VEAEEVSRDGGTVGAGSIGSIGNEHFSNLTNKEKLQRKKGVREMEAGSAPE
jgi:hypothetical protein